MFPVVCDQCGKETEVPFEPRQGRPVYCSDCYNQVKPR
jgi:CxxC-x17-CxxC domain-containing protein